MPLLGVRLLRMCAPAFAAGWHGDDGCFTPGHELDR